MLVYPSIILRGNKQLNFVEGKKSKSCVEKKVFTTFTPNLSFPTFILHYPKKGKEGDISAQVEVNELCPIPFFSAGGATFLTNCFVILLEGLLLWDILFTKTCWNKKVKIGITTVKKCIQSCMHTWATSICQLPTLCQSLQQSSFQTLEIILHTQQQ